MPSQVIHPVISSNIPPAPLLRTSVILVKQVWYVQFSLSCQIHYRACRKVCCTKFPSALKYSKYNAHMSIAVFLTGFNCGVVYAHASKWSDDLHHLRLYDVTLWPEPVIVSH